VSAPFDLAVRGGTVVSPRGRARRDVYVRGERIVELSPPGEPRDAIEALDATGLLVLPGMVDTHVHFMDPGDPTREDFPTGTAAAAVRGVTTVVEHTHAWPVTSTARLAEKRAHLEGRARVDYGLAAHVWPDRLDEVEPLWRAGVAYFKAFTCATHGVPACGNDVLMDLGGVVGALGAPVLVHCEDDALTSQAERRLREAGREDGGVVPEWRSRAAELLSAGAVALVARLTGACFVIAHASHPEVLELVASERAAGSRVLAESCPQYFFLHEDEVLDHGAFRKFTPPARIRSGEEERRMWSTLDAGLVHHLSSDHAPATAAQKRSGDVWATHFGLPGLDTTLALMLDAALAGRIALERVVELYADAPARLYGLRGKGRLEPGADADLELVDPTATWTLEDRDVVSRAGWTPYAGRRLRGRVAATVLRGREVARDGALVDERRTGRFVPGAGATAPFAWHRTLPPS
jgi:allantoinase